MNRMRPEVHRHRDDIASELKPAITETPRPRHHRITAPTNWSGVIALGADKERHIVSDHLADTASVRRIEFESQ